MSIKNISRVLASILITTSLVSCGEGENIATNTSSSTGDAVVATSVAVTEILDALDVQVSGVPTSSYELPESTKDAVQVGNPMSPDLEIIKSLNPKVVVSVDTLGSDYEKLFTDNNIPSEFVSLSSLEDLKTTIKTLGDYFNKKEKAEELINNINSKQEEVSSSNENVQSPNLLVLFAAPGSTMLATTKSYIGSLVELVGGKNIIEDTSSPYVNYNNEELTKLNPDKILVMTHALPEETKAALEKEFSTSSVWQNVEAVKNGNVVYLDNNYFGMSANLKVTEALGMLKEIVYGSKEQ